MEGRRQGGENEEGDNHRRKGIKKKEKEGEKKRTGEGNEGEKSRRGKEGVMNNEGQG